MPAVPAYKDVYIGIVSMCHLVTASHDPKRCFGEIFSVAIAPTCGCAAHGAGEDKVKVEASVAGPVYTFGRN
jgi:hypothetical protein